MPLGVKVPAGIADVEAVARSISIGISFCRHVSRQIIPLDMPPCGPGGEFPGQAAGHAF
jgi:hypothetical protein